jgi:putative transcription factor
MAVQCEICGSSIRGEVQAVNIDGGVFRVCNSCSRLGKPARLPKPVSTLASNAQGSFASSSSIGANPISLPEEELELRQDFNKVIKVAREKSGMSQEELGRKINEKPSVISHLEVGKLKPDNVLARKLEHALKIQLLVPEGFEPEPGG